MDYGELLNQLKLRFPSMNNSTHQYDVYLLRRLRADNVSWWNNSWPDATSNYDPVVMGDAVLDECFPFLGVLDFFHLYYIPTIILTGMSFRLQRFKNMFMTRVI
jgi:DNA segregation ATPase FtsK/SpoIIIE-like protein